jgi:enoyl-CoA hydratase
VTGCVLVLPLGVRFELEDGESLMAAAQRRGYYWPTICKGNAQCNRCAVRVIDGAGLEPRSATELTGLRAVKWRDGVEDDADRLACQLRAHGDAVVEKRGVRALEQGRDDMSEGEASGVLLVDEPLPKVRRLTLNRPEKRNALNDALRGALFEELRRADRDRGISVIVIRGHGPCFSAGYDLGSPNHDVERAIAKVDGWWSRHVVNNWFEMWDMATPIIAQVHGYCLAGGTELATACDLVYVAEDAAIGYPPVRLMSPPDMQWQTWMMGLRHGMEALLTGDSMTGVEAAQRGFANRAHPLDELEAAVLSVAERVAKVPLDLLALNKRSAHRAMEAMGIRAGIRATAEIQALGFHQPASREYLASFASKGVSAALSDRDRAFGDYRETAARED